MNKLSTLLIVFILFAITSNCARLGRGFLNGTPMGENKKISRPIEKEVKEPEEQDTINYQVERPFQIKKNLVQMKLCCSKALFSKTKMKCNCH